MNGGTNAMDHIERDLGRTRARLDANIDTLQQKFAPADLVDQAMSYLVIRFTHPSMMTRYGWGAVRAQA